ncbi:MAG: biotin/lipoyl-binding protein [Candidatus Aegiribacteria sp.]|nr:biotin/lipoyl-binding protein [Candidatus Aegiribacteria sp.]
MVAYLVSDGNHTLKVEASRLEVRPHDELFQMEIDGKKKIISISRISPAHLSILIDGKSFNVEVEHFEKDYQVSTRGEVYNLSVIDEREVTTSSEQSDSGEKVIKAPMPGLVVEINVNEGDQVKAGDTLLVLEAMKMQNEIAAPASGIILNISVKSGATVNSGDDLLVLDT